MTAAAMIVGMIPMAIGGAGEEQNAALARAVIGGLLFATPTTLLVVPCLFAMLRKGNDGKPLNGAVFEEAPMNMNTAIEVEPAARGVRQRPAAGRRRRRWLAGLALGGSSMRCEEAAAGERRAPRAAS